MGIRNPFLYLNFMDRHILKESKTHAPKEVLYLQSTGCKWGNCEFCGYKDDVSSDPYIVNGPVIKEVTGIYGTLDVVVSGSFTELDPKSLKKLKSVIKQKNIQELHIDLHYMYRSQIPEIRSFFAPCQLKIRCMVGSFLATKRLLLKKGLSATATAKEIAKDFQGANLFCCFNGDSQESILIDISEGLQNFEYLSIKVAHDQSGFLHRDEVLAQWFIHELYPTLKKNPRITIEL